jgi:hypothetical protein
VIWDRKFFISNVFHEKRFTGVAQLHVKINLFMVDANVNHFLTTSNDAHLPEADVKRRTDVFPIRLFDNNDVNSAGERGRIQLLIVAPNPPQQFINVLHAAVKVVVVVVVRVDVKVKRFSHKRNSNRDADSRIHQYY